MNPDNPNPYVIPGRPRYNPLAQSQTEADAWMAQMYPGYSDPTQVPMIPGDTERAMYPPQSQSTNQNNGSAQQPIQNVPQQMIELMHRMAATIQPESAATTLQSANQTLSISPGQHVQPIRIPIVFDLTFNLTINLNINPQQNG